MIDPTPEEERGKTYRQKENLNYLGEWVETLNCIFDTNQAAMAKLAGIGKNTLSIATRNPNSPSRDVLRPLVEAYTHLSQERGIVLPRGWVRYFYLTWLGPDIEGADQMLASLKSWANFAGKLEQSQNGLGRDQQMAGRNRPRMGTCDQKRPCGYG